MDQDTTAFVRPKELEEIRARHKEIGGWQQRKSQITQLHILEASVLSIVEAGFAQVRTQDIAKRAGVSRGALMHHFANKHQLFEKTLAFVHERRLENYKSAISKRLKEGVSSEEGLAVYWEQLQTPYFVAAQELMIAARSDEQLAKILMPQRKDFDAEWEMLTLELFPEWSGAGEVFSLAMKISQFMIEGMAMSRWFDHDDRKDDEMLAYLKQRISIMLSAVHKPGEDAAVDTFLGRK